jgi:hypothetical protein
MIVPTIGRVVWYFPDGEDDADMTKHSDQPFDAHVCYVWSDFRVNLVVFDHDGTMWTRISVPINTAETGSGPHAEWMPYQIGQAKKHEQAT